MGPKPCITCCACCPLSFMIMVYAIIQSFIFGISSVLFLIMLYHLQYYFFYSIFLLVILPRFAVLWCAERKNRRRSKVDTQIRWTLTKV